MVGECLVHLEEAEESRKHFELAREHLQALLESPRLQARLQPETQFYLGLVQRALGQNELARTQWEQVIRDSPDSEWAQFAQEQLTNQP